jgi:hypothetical protein
MPEDERRKFSRIPFNSIAIVRNRKTQTEGEIDNLSLNGVLLKTSEKIETGCDLELEIFLIEPASDISIKLCGKVLRQTSEGIAVQFTGMYLDDFGRLRDQIANRIGDKGKVIEEFLEYLTQ